MLGTVRVRDSGGRDHRGRAALRPRSVVGRATRPHRRVPGLHAVRRHTVRVRGQGGVAGRATVLSGVLGGADRVRTAVLVRARVAGLPVQRGPVRTSGIGAEVSMKLCNMSLYILTAAGRVHNNLYRTYRSPSASRSPGTLVMLENHIFVEFR